MPGILSSSGEAETYGLPCFQYQGHALCWNHTEACEKEEIVGVIAGDGADSQKSIKEIW